MGAYVWVVLLQQTLFGPSNLGSKPPSLFFVFSYMAYKPDQRVIITLIYKAEAPKWPKTRCLKRKRQRPCFNRDADFIILIIIYTQNMYIRRTGGSGVVRPKMSNIPRPVGLLLRLTWVFVLSNIDKVVWPVVQILPDHKGSFSRWW